MTIEQRLLRDCGTTEEPCLAVWLLPDGEWVNGSCEGFQRDQDHHEIGAYFRPSVRQEPGSTYIYIRKFMRRGNIRVSCAQGFCRAEMLVPPTRSQVVQVLEKFGPLARDGWDVLIERAGAATGSRYASMDLPAFRAYVERYLRRCINRYPA